MVYGIGQATPVSDEVPWGLCFAVDVCGGLALAAGGFTLAFAVHMFAFPRWKHILRTTVLLGLAGYVVALLASLSGVQPIRNMWPTVMRGRPQSSLLAGAAGLLLLYGLVGALEFVPERLQLRWGVYRLHSAATLALFAAACFANYHQFAITRVLYGQSHFSPLWVTPRIPLLFFLSSICITLALVIFASWRSTLAWGAGLPVRMLSQLSRLLVLAVFVYLFAWGADLLARGLLPSMFTGRTLFLFWLEIMAFFAGMVWLLGSDRGVRDLYLGSAMVIGGFLANRLNTCLTAAEAVVRRTYSPVWAEVLITYSIVAVGVAAFGLAAKHLAVFPTFSSVANEEG